MLWLSCNRGVAVLDVRTHDLSYPWINNKEKGKVYDIDLVDDLGRLWSESTKGVEVYDPLTTQFKNYFYETHGASYPYIAQRIIEDKSRNQLYMNVSSGDGLYCFDLETLEWTLIPKPANYDARFFYGADLAWLQNGDLLILESSEVFTLSADGQSMVVHPVTAHLPKETIWRNIFVDSRGYIWMGGKNTGVVKITPNTWKVERLESFPNCSDVRFRWIFYEDSQNNIWISNCDGFGMYSYQKNQFQLFPYSSSLSENSLSLLSLS